MSFIPRHAFPPMPYQPPSNILGHHKAGLAKMKSLLSSIDLVLECRDYRLPVTSRNPLFESALESKDRVIVYTKRDLGGGVRDARNEAIIKKWHEPMTTLFVRNGGLGDGDKDKEYVARKSVSSVLDVLREHARSRWKLVGHRVLAVGMPNVGKSTLLNALRASGISKGKVAATGAQPGVTRKVSSGVKIVPSEDDMDAMEAGSLKSKLQGVGGGVYILDTPGVFIPYVPDAEAMMKLALCGSVKDTIITPVILADYLLYHVNLHSPTLYAEYCAPTNNVMDLLTAVAQSTGRLGKGGQVDTEAAALWIIQKWRNGQLGRFLLDSVDEHSLEKAKFVEEGVAPSLNQARKVERERRRERNKARGEK
jgi:ribosome biogenesis GTPase A